MTGRDANQGICAQSCRWKYKVMEQREHFLEEEKRPGEFMPIEEDSHGTYIMNSKDNCLIEYLKDLVEAGVCSFKIEGRNKTVYYLAVVTKAYRKAIDDLVSGKKFDVELLDELMKISNRGYIPGFMKGFPGNDNIYPIDSSPEASCRFIGVIREVSCLGQNDLYRVEVRNRVSSGENVEIIGPNYSTKVVLKEILTLNGDSVPVAHGGDRDVYLRLKKGFKEFDLIRA